MVEFINKLTGTRMYVDESRKAEYLAAGHKPAIFVPEEKATTSAPAQKTRKRAPKRK